MNYVKYHDQFKSTFVSAGIQKEADQKALPYMIAGIRRVLPMLVDARMGILAAVRNGTRVSLYLALEKKIQITDRLLLNPEYELKAGEQKWSLRTMYTIDPRTFVFGGVQSVNRVRTIGVGIRKRL